MFLVCIQHEARGHADDQYRTVRGIYLSHPAIRRYLAAVHQYVVKRSANNKFSFRTLHTIARSRGKQSSKYDRQMRLLVTHRKNGTGTRTPASVKELCLIHRKHAFNFASVCKPTGPVQTVPDWLLGQPQLRACFQYYRLNMRV